MDRYELTIDDINFDGVTAISIVDYPAIEEDFIFLGKEYKFQEINKEKRLIIGPALIPNKDILRYDFFGDEYSIVFKENTIEKIQEKFMKEHRLDNTNLQHAINVNNVTIIESWIIENRNLDKSKALGFDLPKGTWMIAMKVDNDDVWDMIKSGDIKGFSIEGYFTNMIINNHKFSEIEELGIKIKNFIQK